jgi:hypothetical protein
MLNLHRSTSAARPSWTTLKIPNFCDPVFKDELVPILTEHPLRKPMLYVIYASRKHTPLKIRTFIDHFSEFVAASPSDHRPHCGHAHRDRADRKVQQGSPAH